MGDKDIRIIQTRHFVFREISVSGIGVQISCRSIFLRIFDGYVIPFDIQYPELQETITVGAHTPCPISGFFLNVDRLLPTAFLHRNILHSIQASGITPHKPIHIAVESPVLNIKRISEAFGLANRKAFRCTFISFQHKCDRPFLRGLILYNYRLIVTTSCSHPAEEQHVNT